MSEVDVLFAFGSACFIVVFWHVWVIVAECRELKRIDRAMRGDFDE